MAAFEERRDTIGAIPIRNIVPEMRGILQQGMRAQYSEDAVSFRGHMVTLANHKDRTIAIIKEIGKHLLSSELSKKDGKALTDLLDEYSESLSVITKDKIGQLDLEDPDRKRFLLCALQIQEICLNTLYRGSSPPKSAAPERMASLLSESRRTMEQIREVKLAEIRPLCGEEVHREIVELNGRLTALSQEYAASLLSSEPRIQIEAGFADVSSSDKSDRKASMESRQRIIDELKTMSDQLKYFGIPAHYLEFSQETSYNEMSTQLVDGQPTVDSRLFPIDLEVRGGGESQLGVAHSDLIPLDPRWEIPLIQKHFHDAIAEKQSTTRIVLVDTLDLLCTLRGCVHDPKYIPKAVEKLQNGFGKHYELSSSKKLIPHFIEDLLNDDVPYLSEKGGLLYYGLPSRGLVIGKKR